MDHSPHGRPPARARPRPATVAATAVAVAALATAGMGGAGAVEDEPVGAMGTEGLVDTLAGPGHCPRAASQTAGSRQVRAVATADDGRKVYDTGPPQAPVLVTVDRRGEVAGRMSGLPAPTAPPGAPPAVAAAPLAAGRLVADDAGGVIVAAGSQLVRLAPGGERRTLAGDPTSEPGAIGPARSGDGGPADQARFRSAASLAADGDGNLYVADHGGAALGHSVVRVINRSDEPHTFYADTADEMTVAPGDIATLAGAPPADDDQPDNGDDGSASRARQAVFHGATTLAVAGDRLYVASAADESSPQARLAMVNLAGQPVTAHGHTVEPGGLAAVAGGEAAGTLGAAGGVAVDGDDVYVADPARHRVVGLDGDGSVAIVAGAEGLGANIGGFDGNHQAPVGARLNRPVDVALGPEGGTVYVADRDNGQLRAVTPEVVIRGVAGAGAGLAWQCHPPPGADPAAGEQAQPAAGGPASVAVDSDGVVYFALPQAHQVKRRTPDGTIRTVAGRPGDDCRLGCAGFAGDDGPARQAELDTPTAVALGPDEQTLYVYDGGNARLRLVNLSETSVSAHGVTIDAGAIATVAGNGQPARRDSDGGDPGDSSARDARLTPVAPVHLTSRGRQAAVGYGYGIDPLTLGGLAVDGDRTVFLAEPQQHVEGEPHAGDDEQIAGRVRRLAPDGTIATVAGARTTIDDDEPPDQCCVNPAGLAVADNGALYIAGTATYQVWAHNPHREPLRAHGHTIPAGETVAVAGTGTPGFASDPASADQSPLLPPTDVAVDGDTVYVSEVGVLGGHDLGHYLRRIDGDGTLTVVAGHGQPGFNGDLRRPRLTKLNLPAGLAVDPCGNLLVADGGNDRLRRLNLTGPCQPAAAHTSPAASPGPPLLAIGGVAGGALALAGAGWYWHRHRRRTAGLPR